MADKRMEKIAKLNDALRHKGCGGKTFMTAGVQGLGQQAVHEIMKTVASYDDFSEDNNPYGERDYGSFRYGSEKILWKIDYYDSELKYGSEDPSDQAKTCRVLTVMLVSEY